MAHRITELTRHVAPGGDWPYGDTKDNPNGTLVNRLMVTDILQLMQKMMDYAGVVPNGDDDNLANGYQLFEALQHAIALGAPNDSAGAWISGGTPSIIPSNTPSGTVTIDPGDIIYNKYKLVGRTLHWQTKLVNFSIGGTPPTSLIINPPIAFTNYAPQGLKLLVFYNGAATAYVELTGATGPGQCQVKLISGGAFTAGTNNQSLDISICAEILP